MKINYIILLLCGLLVVSCKSEPSLQKYFVEKTEDSNFISLDLSPSILNVDKEKLTPAEEKALNSFEKMNILAFNLGAKNDSLYQFEKLNVQNILKDTKYDELMKVGSGKQGFALSYIGTEEEIDEIIVFANSNETGFAVVRILGDKITPTDMMSFIGILQKSKIDLKQLEPLQKMLPKNNKITSKQSDLKG